MPIWYHQRNLATLYVAKAKLFPLYQEVARECLRLIQQADVPLLDIDLTHSFLQNFIETSNLHRLAQPTKNFFNKNKFRYFLFVCCTLD